MTAAARESRPFVVAHLPPPMHGMARVSAFVVEELRKHGECDVVDISPGSLHRSIAYHARKSARVLRALASLVRRAGHAGALYLPVDARWGALYSLALAVVGRLCGYRLVLHHHAYRYVAKRDARIAALVRLAGGSAVHVFLSAGMAAEFRRRYPGPYDDRVVPNGIFVDDPGTGVSISPRPSRLGLLSNLSAEKGLAEALALARRSMQGEAPFEVHLAGPLTEEDRPAVEEAAGAAGTSLRVWGPVFGAEKDRFFRSIDVFVFPSHYENEAQPLVLLEALAYGRPAIAFGRGCIGELLTGGEGVVVPVGEDFVPRALEAVRRWQSDAGAWQEACRAARERYESEAGLSRSRFDWLVARLGSG